MQELINDVINDLAEGHITKAEAKERVARIINTCQKSTQRDWLLPLSPLEEIKPKHYPPTWPPPVPYWLSDKR